MHDIKHQSRPDRKIGMYVCVTSSMEAFLTLMPLYYTLWRLVVRLTAHTAEPIVL